jgi:translation elongation factor EF-Tu-like GTPase
VSALKPTPAADFEAEVRFISSSECGRQGPAVQWYRPDIQYNDSEELWMVWPIFLDNNGAELTKGTVIPIVSNANFYIINDEFRRRVHRNKLHLNTDFHICEGLRKVAVCRVVKILSLYEDFDVS